jgi:hypothetical protein
MMRRYLTQGIIGKKMKRIRKKKTVKIEEINSFSGKIPNFFIENNIHHIMPNMEWFWFINFVRLIYRNQQNYTFNLLSQFY